MLKGLQGGFTTVAVTVVTLSLVVLELADRSFRGWLAARPFTADTAAGILVVGITVLIVNQVLAVRQLRERSRAIAAQAAIVLGQATRATQATSDAVGGSGDRATARDEVRTYMTMLLIAAPILIDAKTSRTFWEEAQKLGAQLVNVLTAAAEDSGNVAQSTSLLNEALQQLSEGVAPFLQLLEVKPRIA